VIVSPTWGDTARMLGRRASRGLAGAALSGVLLAGCASASSPGAPSPSVSGSAASTSAAPELVVEMFMPPGVAGSGEKVPVVVLVPGGRWLSADPAGMEPLAEALAESGSAVVTTTYRTGGDGASFPVPLEDVVCAVDQATQKVAASGVTPGSVVVVGHSAGAQLAALAALVGDQYQDGCASPPVSVDGFVGLAGPYDIVSVADLATGLLDSSPTEDPDTWRAANPMAQVAARPDLPVLLIHGAADTEVDPSYSKSFAAALEAAGHEVTLLVLPDVDHFAVAEAANAATPLEKFVAGLAAEN
jgi:acetyl esterase/lipase